MSATAAGPAGGIVLKYVAGIAAVALTAALAWVLRSLIVPAVLSGLLAYICRPLVSTLERYRVPRRVAIGLLLLGFVLATLFIVARIRMIVPTEIEALEYRVHALYVLNDHYRRLMGLDATLSRGNRAYQFLHADLDPLVDRANQMLALTSQERQLFLSTRPGGADAPPDTDRLLDEDRANLQTLLQRARLERATPLAAEPPVLRPATQTAPTMTRPLSWLAQVLSTWIIAPFVFFFLLSDTGEIKRGLLSMVPNRLFEPALTVMADLDHALGNWLRGLFLECCLLGISVVVLLALIGIPLRWAIAIGIFTGATNVVPYLGSAVALAGGLAYALLAGPIHPMIPLVTHDNLAIWVVLAVAAAELLKNIYEPVVLGSAAKLHPLVIVIGATGGAILFGLVGVLLAIPAISMLKVFVASTTRQLKAYGLI